MTDTDTTTPPPPAVDVPQIVARLRHAIATHANDDASASGSRERERATERLAVMQEAAAALERLERERDEALEAAGWTRPMIEMVRAERAARERAEAALREIADMAPSDIERIALAALRSAPEETRLALIRDLLPPTHAVVPKDGFDTAEWYFDFDDPESCADNALNLLCEAGYGQIVHIGAAREVGERWGFILPPATDTDDDRVFWASSKAEAQAMLAAAQREMG